MQRSSRETATSGWPLAEKLAVTTGVCVPDNSQPISKTILRPLCGLDYGLRENLESAFLQQWPLDRFEIILCLAHPDDPARTIAQDLIRKYPAVRARLLIGETLPSNPND